MAGQPFLSAGDGKTHYLLEKGIKSDGYVYEVTVVCGVKDITGTTENNGFAAGFDRQLLVWLVPGSSFTFKTRDLSMVTWQDASGAAAYITVFWFCPEVIVATE